MVGAVGETVNSTRHSLGGKYLLMQGNEEFHKYIRRDSTTTPSGQWDFAEARTAIRAFEMWKMADGVHFLLNSRVLDRCLPSFRIIIQRNPLCLKTQQGLNVTLGIRLKGMPFHKEFYPKVRCGRLYSSSGRPQREPQSESTTK